MKHLLLLASLLLVSFSTALADTPAKIAEDYRKAAAAALTKLNGTLEQATTPLIAKLISSGDTDGADALAEQLKAKLAGEPVITPQASAVLLFTQYDQARAKALEPVQKASIARIESLVKSTSGSPKLETLTELSKVRAEIEAGNPAPVVAASAGTSNSTPGTTPPAAAPALTTAGKPLAELVKALGGTYTHDDKGEAISVTRAKLSTPDLLQLGADKRLKSFTWNTGSGLTDEGMAAFEGMKDLKSLHLWATGRLTDEGLKHLSGCEKLDFLNIGGNGDGVIGTGLESLSHCKSLRELTLNMYSKLDGQNLRHLSKLRALKILRLAGCTAVKDADLDWISQITSLENLRLENTSVTDAGLARLAGLRHLKELYVSEPLVTPAGVQALKKARPALVVTFMK